MFMVFVFGKRLWPGQIMKKVDFRPLLAKNRKNMTTQKTHFSKPPKKQN